MEIAGLTVKNTFLTVPTWAQAPGKRSSSTPRTWKPEHFGDRFSFAATRDCFQECLSDVDVREVFEDCVSEKGDDALDERFSEQGTGEPFEKITSDKTECSDGSTDDSLADASEEPPSWDNWSCANTEDLLEDLADLEEWSGESLQPMADPCSTAANAECAPEAFDAVCAPCTSKVTLNLFDTVCPDEPDRLQSNVRSRLRSSAKAFTSVTTPPVEVTSLVAGAADVLRNSFVIEDVKVRDGGMGGTTLIMAHPRAAAPDSACVLSSVKDSLLHMAEQTENTYILGYNAHPFESLDATSFGATIARVPDSHKRSACWDFYEKGFCSRCATCRWDHPSNMDQMKLIVTITKPAEF